MLKILIIFLLIMGYGLQDLPAQANGAPPIYWYPAKFRPQVLVRGAVAGAQTVVRALYVEYSSPAPTYASFLIGKYSAQYIAALPGIGVLHIPGVMWSRSFWLRLKYPARIIEFPLFSGYIHPSLKGTEWCLQAYFSWGPFGHPSEPHWLSYPVRITIK